MQGHDQARHALRAFVASLRAFPAVERTICAPTVGLKAQYSLSEQKKFAEAADFGVLDLHLAGPLAIEPLPGLSLYP
jgi:hypothetical protein